MQELLHEKQDLWTHLGRTDRPIFLYGMGDGAEKILSVLERRGVSIAGFFASDEFVRGHSFKGHLVRKYSEVRAEHPDLVALLAFAIDYEPMLSRLNQIDKECEFYAPDVPVIPMDEQVFDLDYLRRHEPELDEVYHRLADEQSRRVFRDVLDYKISGKIRYLRGCETETAEAYRLLELSPGEAYVDLGAYNGDTVREFLRYCPSYERIIAFEPDSRNFRKLTAYLKESRVERAKAYPFGAWSEPGTLYFKGGKGGRNSMLSKEGSRAVEVDTVDRVCTGRVSLLKLDVEGAESEAVRGASCTIREQKPKIMLSAYHKNEDLFALPLQILELNPAYRVYLRHHPYVPAWETNFYFI